MAEIGAEYILMILCGLIVLSYFFTIISKSIRVPSVLLLLFTGVIFKLIANYYQLNLVMPVRLVEGLGGIGLTMIILEAGLDLRLDKSKFKLIRDSFISALTILILSAIFVTGILYFWLHEPIIKCIVYAVPLSIMSSSIVLPSIHHLTEHKKEFLVYEASFSDILGVMFFNYFTAEEVFTAKSAGVFGLSILISIILSLIISVALLFLLAKTKVNVKFFLVFALLVIVYSGGKLLHLPSLLIILAFGLLINNWDKVPMHRLDKVISDEQVSSLRSFLHSITAETSFLVRTFFFLLFGFSFDLNTINDLPMIIVGSLVVIALFFIRYVYLRFYFKTKAFPESFFIPRGLITIVLFYKIPQQYKLTNFNDGILFFIILATGIILSIGMIAYKKQSDEVTYDPIFARSKETI